jgi:hypothetical protein
LSSPVKSSAANKSARSAARLPSSREGSSPGRAKTWFQGLVAHRRHRASPEGHARSSFDTKPASFATASSLRCDRSGSGRFGRHALRPRSPGHHAMGIKEPYEIQCVSKMSK